METILEQEGHPFLYTAVPSLLAAQLAGQTCTLGGGTIPIRWRLVQQAEKHLALTSDPIHVEFTTSWGVDIQGHFAYLIEFLPHNEPGVPLNHFIHIRISCRRYVEKRVVKLLGKRNASFLIGIHQPRIIDPQETWPALPILVPLPIRQSANGKRHWSNRLARLLKAFQTNEQLRGPAARTLRPLEDLADLCLEPHRFWAGQRAKDADEYYLLFAEGIKPSHRIKSGFSPRELYEVWQAIMQLSSALLAPVPSIKSSAEIAHLNKGRVLSLIPFWELQEEKKNKETQHIKETQVLTPFQGELPRGKKTARLGPKNKQDCCYAALERVFPKKKIGLIFL